MAQAALIVTFDTERAPITTKLRVAVETVAQLADEDARVDYIDGSPVTRQQALDAAARLIHGDVRRSAELDGRHGAHRNGMRDLILELFGADDLDDDAGRAYVDQELTIRLRRLDRMTTL